MVIARARTPEGRLVELDSHAWDHVVVRHPEMKVRLDDVITAISHPDHREPDVRAGRERFFHRAGARDWIRVVTEFAGDRDRVVTAFPQLSDPRPTKEG